MYNLVITLLIIGIISSIAMVVYVSFLESSKVQTIALLLTLSCTILFVGYLSECIATNEEQAIMSVKMGYLGKPISLFLFYAFLVQYCREKNPRWLTIIMIVFELLISAMAITCDKHNLFYSSIEYDPTRTFGKLILGHGIFYHMNIFSSVIYFVLEVRLFIKEYKVSRTNKEKLQLLFMFLALLFTLLGFTAFLVIDTKGFDTTILGCFMSLVMFFILLVKFKMFDTVLIAKNDSIDKSTSGLIVIDHREKLAYINPIAQEILDYIKVERNDMYNQLKNKEEIKEDVKNIYYKGTYYNIIVREIEKDKIYYGRTIEFNDITNEVNYSTILENEVKERTKRIIDIQRTVVNSFANLVEERDKSTGDHIKNTSNYVRITVDALRKTEKYKDYINDKYRDTIISAAPLHDIGKVAISDNILLKNGKLTKEEFEEIKKHSEIGGDIIEKNLRGLEEDAYVDIAKTIAIYHHEWWNGCGYPKGLKGEEIPLSARIMAIADVYDALRSKRCYKDGYSKEDSIEIMKRESGSHFDPFVLECFLDNIDSIE